MALRSINIDFDVHQEIEKRRKSFEDLPNDVLRRVFNLANVLPNETISKKVDETSGLYTEDILIPNGTKLRKRNQSGELFEAEIKGGQLIFNGKKFNSLSAAASSAAGGNRNGWTYWDYFDKSSGKWLTCDMLRKNW